jgi:hypothetical protein
MAVTERERRVLYERAEQALGSDGADTLMGLLSRSDWSEIASKDDIDRLEAASKRDIAASEHALRAEIEATTQRLRAEIAATKQELHSEIAATRQDIRETEARIMAAMHKEINRQTLRFFALVVTLIVTLVPALVVPLVTLR